jgi:major vault protein
VVDAYVLTEKKALHVRSLRTFTDNFGKKRLNGEEWLIKMSDTETHIPGVYEEVIGVINVTTLSSRQYVVIMDPVGADDGKPQLGKKALVKGERSFFLQPGERLENGIQEVYVLSDDEGLILKCVEAFVDNGKKRVPGDLWMVKGPTDYVPCVEVEVKTRRKALPLDENEGIYVRDVKSGKIRAIIGVTYMLNQDEEMWDKELPQEVEALLVKDALADRNANSVSKAAPKRNKSSVVTYRVPHNGAVQIYDYKEKRSRVIFGPELVMLGPDEQVTKFSCYFRLINKRRE